MSGIVHLFEAVCSQRKTERVTLHVKIDFHGLHAWQRPFNTKTVDDFQYTFTLRIMPRAYLSENEKWQVIRCINSGQSI
jgi:hypothetical protein